MIVTEIMALDEVESSGCGHEIVLARPAAAFGELTNPLNTQLSNLQLSFAL